MADSQPAQNSSSSKVAQPKGFLSRLFAAGPLMPQQQMSPAASAAQDHKLDDKHEDFHPELTGAFSPTDIGIWEPHTHYGSSGHKKKPAAGGDAAKSSSGWSVFG